jgi:hypothetical protein
MISEGRDEPVLGGAAPSLPLSFKILVSIVVAVVLVPVLVLIWQYIHDPQSAASPKELGLSGLIIFCLSALILVWVPWDRLGLTVKKIGGFEFERVVTGQAQEHVEEIAELHSRIAELEGKVGGLDELGPIGDHFAGTELRPLLLKFLEMHRPTAFSPVKIKRWGSSQPGFEKLANYSQGQIRRTLQQLVLEDKVATAVSRLGNTLYRIVQ